MGVNGGGTYIKGGETNREVQDHIVRWVVTILIADLIGQHSQGTGFTVR